MLQWSYYTYWSGLPVDGFEIVHPPRPRLGGAPDERRPDAARRRLAVRRVDGLQGRRRGQLPQDPRARRPSSPSASAARRARSGSPAASVPNFFRKPYGPGWALVGDAGYNKDPITAQGISDAFRDAELCADALDDAFAGGRSFDDAMAELPADPRRPRRCRSTSSRPSSPRSSRRRPRCSSCSAPSTATRTRWTPSSASPPGPCRRVEFFDPADIGRLLSGSSAA